MQTKIYINIFFGLLCSFVSFSQDQFELLKYSGIIKAEVFVTTNEELDISDILKPDYQLKFESISKKKPILPEKIYWYRMDFTDIDLNATDKWLIRFLNYDSVNLFYLKGDSIITNGKEQKYFEGLNHRYVEFPFGKKNLFNERILYAKIINNTRSFSLGQVVYLNPLIFDFQQLFYSKKDLTQQIIYIMFIGGMVLITAYFFGIYFIYKNKLFILYVLYLLSLLLYLGTKAAFIEIPLRNYFGFYFSIFHELIQVLVNIFYLLFASLFLNARKDFPKLYVAIRYMVKILLLVMFIQIILMLTDEYLYLERYLMKYERYFVILFSFWAYYHICRNYKDQIVFFLLIGSFLYIIGGLSALQFGEVGYMMLGASLEVFVFSMGMGYRVKKIEEEKNSIENEIVKVQLTALKAQMNPHFIFNSLNSIRAYVISNDTKMASDYLTKFSNLIRLILQYSSQNSISLKDELDALILYVHLEQLRYRDDFGFELKIDKAVDVNNWKVPPLILQPYVENAIRHGLSAKKGVKKLELDISLNNSNLIFRLKDNGVGRQYAKRLQKLDMKEHISMAMDLTQKRIELADFSNSNSESITIVDLMEDGKQTGTEVIFKLPVNKGKLIPKINLEA